MLPLWYIIIYFGAFYKGYEKYVQQNPAEESLPFCICVWVRFALVHGRPEALRKAYGKHGKPGYPSAELKVPG